MATDTKRRRPMPWWMPLVAGAALGLSAELFDLAASPWLYLGALGAPWLLVAFFVGAGARSWLRGAGLAVVALLVALAAYYASKHLLEPKLKLRYLLRFESGFFAGISLTAGPVFGAMGWIWRRRPGWPRAIAAALATSALIAEAIVQIAVRHEAVYGNWIPWLELVASLPLFLLIARGKRPRMLSIAWLPPWIAAGVWWGWFWTNHRL